MSRFLARIAGFFSNRTQVGVDKAGNRYFTRKEEIDGIMKEKRWVVFKGEVDSTNLPVEWICWLNGQRKQAPTPEEMAELEARRELVKKNVALLKKEEEERKAKGSTGKFTSAGKVGGPDLRSFIRQLPSEGDGAEESSATTNDSSRNSQEKASDTAKVDPESSEPTGSGPTFKPGTWQPPT